MADWAPRSNLAKAVYEAGFLYCPNQDIIYSRRDAHQRQLGYCWAYDCISAPTSMVIDCEPFYFTYGGNHWMIELWKGQYGLETGCEIGVYCDYLTPTVNQKLRQNRFTAAEGLRVDPTRQSRFYSCAQQQDWPTMTSRLWRDGTVLLHRGPEPHWWLTGFKWGVFTQHTSELTLDVEIDFTTVGMCDAFKTAATDLRYQLHEKGAFGVAFTFGIPHTTQPQSRAQSEASMQKVNKELVDGYNQLKEALHISNNDPNAFTQNVAEAAAARVIARVESRLPHWASAAAKAVDHQAAAAARRVEHEVSEKGAAAFHHALTFYEKKVWRTTRKPVFPL